jgi:hypothetical protein
MESDFQCLPDARLLILQKMGVIQAGFCRIKFWEISWGYTMFFSLPKLVASELAPSVVARLFA